ncbi:hypothetical protein E4K10_42020 [Streptomyces sp. T1317-0309]|nr:hypothetical protein E4K10_42020 [Streptomyces sp. T1317-0309]
MFGRLPAEGGWRTVLLIDGNIGIGGDPRACWAESHSRRGSASGSPYTSCRRGKMSRWAGGQGGSGTACPTPSKAGAPGPSSTRLRRPLAGRGGPQRTRAASPDLRSHWSHRRRATTPYPRQRAGCATGTTRYTWVRDASFTLQALATAACEKEKNRFFDFLARAAATQLDRGVDLQIMYGIGGEHDLSERLLPHLTGWRNSRPVRIGNDAWRQRQLDVYGELLDAAHGCLPPGTAWPRHPRLPGPGGRRSRPSLDPSPTKALGESRAQQTLRALETHVLGRPGRATPWPPPSRPTNAYPTGATNETTSAKPSRNAAGTSFRCLHPGSAVTNWTPRR